MRAFIHAKGVHGASSGGRAALIAQVSFARSTVKCRNMSQFRLLLPGVLGACLTYSETHAVPAALDLIVRHRISGLPVLDVEKRVV